MTGGLDLEAVLSHYGVSIGRRRMVSCPFHPDDTPSCSINPAKGVWHCFSCGEAGDAWSLIMKKEGLDFGGARQWAEANLGVAGGSDGRGGDRVSGSAFGGRRRVAGRKGNRPGNSGYRPSWRR